MSGRRLVVSFLLVGVVLTSSCGMVNDARGESTGAANLPERDSRPRAETDSGPAGEVGPSTSTTTTAAAPSTTAPTTSTTAPPLSQRDDLSPVDLAAIDRCQRVASFKSAGYAVYETTLGDDAVPVGTIGDLVDSLNALIPAVSAAGDEVLQSVLGILEPEARRMMSEPEVPVAEVQALTDRVAPQLTDLLVDLMHGCPLAIDADDVDQAERVRLGTPSL